MKYARIGLVAAGVVLAVAVVLAIAAIWQFFADPVGFATAIDQGPPSRLLVRLASAITSAVLALLKWL